MKRDHHRDYVRARMKRSARFRHAYRRNRHKVDLAILVAQMREAAGLSQAELAARIGTAQPVIARLENAEYDGHSLKMLEKIATACGVTLKLHAQKKPKLELEVALV
jgi:ribosome-binding protein aMBF1 (putative translation factor)